MSAADLLTYIVGVIGGEMPLKWMLLLFFRSKILCKNASAVVAVGGSAYIEMDKI